MALSSGRHEERKLGPNDLIVVAWHSGWRETVLDDEDAIFLESLDCPLDRPLRLASFPSECRKRHPSLFAAAVAMDDRQHQLCRRHAHPVAVLVHEAR